MNESVLAMLNQQFNNGQAFGQQGTFAEMQGNYFVAAQNYDQSIWWIYQSMVMAQQSECRFLIIFIMPMHLRTSVLLGSRVCLVRHPLLFPTLTIQL